MHCTEACGNVMALYLRDYIIAFVLMLKCSDVSWYCDTFGVMHQYFYALYRPISNRRTRASHHMINSCTPCTTAYSYMADNLHDMAGTSV